MDLFILGLVSYLIHASSADSLVDQATDESRQQNLQYGNTPSVGGGYISTYDSSRGPFIQEYQNVDLDSILAPKIELSKIVNKGLGPKLDYPAIIEKVLGPKIELPTIIDKGFDYGVVGKQPYYDYKLEGRQGLGFDKRTAYALGLRYPLTPELLETVVRPKGSKLRSEQYSGDY